jgi:hypothetical protein
MYRRLLRLVPESTKWTSEKGWQTMGLEYVGVSFGTRNTEFINVEGGAS